MPGLILREAVYDDSEALKKLERVCPQGTTLQITSERKDYFFRSKLYGNHYTLVAETGDEIIGVAAAVKKEVTVNGKTALAVFLYDLRVHPSFRRTFGGRIMLRAWKMIDSWAEETGADFKYGFVKSDNLVMRGFFKRKNYVSGGSMHIAGKPVYRHRKTAFPLEKIDCGSSEMYEKFTAEYGKRNLLPVVFKNQYLTEEMKVSGIYDCYIIRKGDSSASVCLARVSEIVSTRVVKMPGYLRIAAALLRIPGKIIKLPAIPGEGSKITYYHCFNHTAGGPEGIRLWKDLMKHMNNITHEAGNILLTSSFDGSDRFRKPFSKGSVSRIKYIIGYSRLNKDLPDKLSPFYPDPRDAD